MIRSAALKINTCIGENSAITLCDVTVNITNNNMATFNYSQDGIPMCIGVGTDCITITRFDEDNYTLVLKKDETNMLMLKSGSLLSCAISLNTKFYDKGIIAKADYWIGSTDNIIKMKIQAKYTS